MQLRSGRIIQNQTNNNNNNTNVQNNSIIDYKEHPKIKHNVFLTKDLDYIYSYKAKNSYYLNSENKLIIVNTIKRLLAICEYTYGAENKLPITLIIMSVINTQLGRMLLRSNYKFTQVVRDKFYEFMTHEKVDHINKIVFMNMYNQLIDAKIFRDNKLKSLPKAATN